MTKEEVLQKVNDYCTEKQYTKATLTDAFKDKFADHFQKANSDGDINDENIQKSLKFALNTAFSSASELATVKVSEFETKENDYKRQITELKGKINDGNNPPVTPPSIPKEIEDDLKELKAFRDKQARQERLSAIVKMAKEGIRKDLHGSFDRFVADYNVSEKEDKEQADALVTRFQEIFRDSIGDIKPRSSTATRQQDEDFLKTVPVIKVC